MKDRISTKYNRERDMSGSLGNASQGDLAPSKGYQDLGREPTRSYRAERNLRPHAYEGNHDGFPFIE